PSAASRACTQPGSSWGPSCRPNPARESCLAAAVEVPDGPLLTGLVLGTAAPAGSGNRPRARSRREDSPASTEGSLDYQSRSDSASVLRGRPRIGSALAELEVRQQAGDLARVRRPVVGIAVVHEHVRFPRG